MHGAGGVLNAPAQTNYVLVLFYANKVRGASEDRRNGDNPRHVAHRPQPATVRFTVSTSCFRLKGLGRKLKASPSGRFLRNASSA